MSEFQLQNMVGVVVNVSPTNEPPLRFARRICANGRPSFDRGENDRKGVRQDVNYRDAEFGLDLQVVPDEYGLFGEAAGAEDLNCDTYDDNTDEYNSARVRALRAKLGLDPAPPIPGFPAKSFG
jgi:hypothetical protein